MSDNTPDARKCAYERCGKDAKGKSAYCSQKCCSAAWKLSQRLAAASTQPDDDGQITLKRGAGSHQIDKVIKHQRQADWRERILSCRAVGSDGQPTPTYRGRNG